LTGGNETAARKEMNHKAYETLDFSIYETMVTEACPTCTLLGPEFSNL
jgi:hypothetical protein